jgi:DNA-binding MarR family transcriptional regulator
MVHTIMGKATVRRTADRANPGDELARLERELAVLVRHLERLGRSSDLYTGMGTGRAGYLLLMTLEEAGAATIGTLAATLGLDASTVTRQIAAMEAEGLIERTNDPQDRRCSIISASARGRSLLRSVRERRTDRVDTLLREWPVEDRAALARLLARLNQAIAAGATGQPPVEEARATAD